MLKFVFWILVALNALVFAYAHGYLGKPKGNEHEPARVRQQVAADKLALVPAAQAQAAAASAAPAPAAPQAVAAPVPAAAQPVACLEVGTFAANSARRFETRLARLDLGEHQARKEVQEQDVTSYLVHIPPLGSKEAAERKVAELRALGVDNLFIMSGDSPLKWAISLGVFKSESAARTLQASLARQGARGVRIYPRGPMSTRFAYEFRGIDADTRTQILGIADKFDSAEARDCR